MRRVGIHQIQNPQSIFDCGKGGGGGGGGRVVCCRLSDAIFLGTVETAKR